MGTYVSVHFRTVRGLDLKVLSVMAEQAIGFSQKKSKYVRVLGMV